MMAVVRSVIVDLDSRRRVSLGKVGRKQDLLYLASVDETTGAITLTPAMVVPKPNETTT